MKYKETEQVELKKSTSELKEAMISIAAILNKHQKGRVFFGINNNGKVVGQQVSEKTIKDVSQAVSASIEPKIYPKIEHKTIDKKECVLLEFEGNEIPYFAFGRVYMRVGDEDRQISARELEKMITEKNKIKTKWEDETCKKAALKDINSRTVKKFVTLVKKSKKLSIGNENVSMILKKLGLMRGKKLTNASIILFGKDPGKFFSNTVIKCGRFKGITKEEFIDMKDFDCNLFECLEKSIEFLKNHLRLSAKIEGLVRVERWEIPVEALREAVINALIHRDYRDSSFTYIKVYDESIVIANPGTLPESLKISDLYKEHESKPYNPLLARVFYYTGYIDMWGRGILNIIKYVRSEGLEMPSFEQTAGSFRIIFNRPEPREEAARKTVGKTVEKILLSIKENPAISVNELVVITDLTRRGVEWNISKLKEKGIIKRIGPDKGGYWEVAK